VNPPGDEGDQVYNITYHVMQYCNGQHWVAMGSHSGSGGGGSDNLGNHMAEQALDMGGFRIENLAPPSASTDAASKAYVDAAVGGSTPNLSAVLTAGNAAGNKKITGLAAPTVSTDATTKSYVDNALANKVSKAGDTMTGHLNVPLTPTANAHAASKQYVDNVASSGGLPACQEGEMIIMGASAWQCHARSCDGVEVAGACWILAEPATSCAATCAIRGGYNEATRTYAGSAGSDANCTSILTSLLGHALEDYIGSEDCGEYGFDGLGCLAVAQIEGTPAAVGVRCTTPATTAEGSLPSYGVETARRACACNRGPF